MSDNYAYTTPKYLLPQMEDVPATEPAFYRSLFILDRLGPRDTAAGAAAVPEGPAPTSNTQELTAPIDPFDGRGEEFETLPAIGVLTVHQQGWVQKGIALGNLTQSICLAPGEVTQVAVIDWRRTTTGTSEEAHRAGRDGNLGHLPAARGQRGAAGSRGRGPAWRLLNLRHFGRPSVRAGGKHAGSQRFGFLRRQHQQRA